MANLLKRKKRRSLGTLFVAMVGIPVVAFVGVMAVDLTTTIAAYRHASNISESAALAGASQFETNRASLNDVRANNQAQQLVINAFNGTGKVTPSYMRLTSVGVNVRNSQAVDVTVYYQVTGRIVLPLFEAVTGESSGISSTRVFTTQRTASVCVPASVDQPGGTQGFCQRPSY